jgi:hypothetical protein
VRPRIAWLVGFLVLAAAGFALASIARGSSDIVAQTQTTTAATTTQPPPTVTVTTTVTSTQTQTVTVRRTARVTICHRTGRARPFAVTRIVSASALFAHFRHGDLPGRCTAAKIRQMKKRR